MEKKYYSREHIESIQPKKTNEGSWFNKHKIPGKHKLKYDSIFKGKKEDVDENELFGHKLEGFEIDKESNDWKVKNEFDEQTRLKDLDEAVHKIIVDKTSINLEANRRKPSRTDFNVFFQLIIENIDMNMFSYGEVFVVLSAYFSENIYNMFKLLNYDYGVIIIKELYKEFKITKINGVDFV